jgi:hypothetical protein
MTGLGLGKAALAILTVSFGILLTLNGLNMGHYRKGLRQQNPLSFQESRESEL